MIILGLLCHANDWQNLEVAADHKTITDLFELYKKIHGQTLVRSFIVPTQFVMQLTTNFANAQQYENRWWRWRQFFLNLGTEQGNRIN